MKTKQRFTLALIFTILVISQIGTVSAADAAILEVSTSDYYLKAGQENTITINTYTINNFLILFLLSYIYSIWFTPIFKSGLSQAPSNLHTFLCKLTQFYTSHAQTKNTKNNCGRNRNHRYLHVYEGK